MGRRMTARTPLLLLILAACAAPRAVDGDERLAAELAGRAPGPAQACVARVEGRSLLAIDRRTIVYRTADVVWVSRLDRDCPGLGPLSTLIVEPSGGRFCRGDRISGRESGATIPGPACPLGDFIPYRR